MPLLQRVLVATILALAVTSCIPDESEPPSEPTAAIVGREAPDAATGALVFPHCTGQHHCELATSGPDGSDFRLLTRNDFWVHGPTWSPSGEWIAFQRDGGEDQGIYVIRPTGEDLLRIAETVSHVSASDPCWVDEDTVGFRYRDHFATSSLDDPEVVIRRGSYEAGCNSQHNSFVFSRRVHTYRGGDELVVDQIVVRDREAGSSTVLAQSQRELSAPLLSPDGRWVAFCSPEPLYGGASWVGLARSDGKGRWERLRSMTCEHIEWTPDGKELVVGPCHRDSYTLVDARTGRARTIEVGFDVTDPDWR